jgi:hypothetical protein
MHAKEAAPALLRPALLHPMAGLQAMDAELLHAAVGAGEEDCAARYAAGGAGERGCACRTMNVLPLAHTSELSPTFVTAAWCGPITIMLAREVGALNITT